MIEFEIKLIGVEEMLVDVMVGVSGVEELIGRLELEFEDECSVF